jgi:hypothetical protein
MRRAHFIILIALLALGLSACVRERIRRDTQAPAPQENTATSLPATETVATFSEAVPTTESPTSPESTSLPEPDQAPSATPLPQPTAPPPTSAAPSAASDVESILNELEQLLGNTNTNVTVP